MEEYGKVLENQQSILERLPNNMRRKNVIFTGIKEEQHDNNDVSSICELIAPQLISDSKLIFDYKRLGNKTAHKPRPLLVALSGESKVEVENVLLQNGLPKSFLLTGIYTHYLEKDTSIYMLL